MDFRRATALDAPGIAKMEDEIFPDGWSERDVTDVICTDGSMCFVATDDSGTVAYVLGRMIAPEGEIYRVAVRPDKRQRGLGYRLLDYAVKTSRGRGLESIFLEVRSRNIPAIKLYTSYGFRKAGVRKNYYKDPADDAIVMLRVNPHDLI